MIVIIKNIDRGGGFRYNEDGERGIFVVDWREVE